MTRILTVHPQAPEPESIAYAAAAILRGRLVAFPTETVYGLGANALDAAAVARIFIAKDRPPEDPLIVHLASEDDLPRVVSVIPPVAHELARAFWPGPLTLILPKHPRVPDNVTAGLSTGPSGGIRPFTGQRCAHRGTLSQSLWPPQPHDSAACHG